AIRHRPQADVGTIDKRVLVVRPHRAGVGGRGGTNGQGHAASSVAVGGSRSIVAKREASGNVADAKLTARTQGLPALRHTASPSCGAASSFGAAGSRSLNAAGVRSNSSASRPAS